MQLLFRKCKRYKGRPRVQLTKHDYGTPELQRQRGKRKKLAETPAFYSCPLIQLFTVGKLNEQELKAGLIYRTKLFQAYNNMGIMLTVKPSLAKKLGIYGKDFDNKEAEKLYWHWTKQLWQAGLRKEKTILDDAIINNQLPSDTRMCKEVLSKLSKII